MEEAVDCKLCLLAAEVVEQENFANILPVNMTVVVVDVEFSLVIYYDCKCTLVLMTRPTKCLTF